MQCHPNPDTISADFVVHPTMETCTAVKIPILGWVSIPAKIGTVHVEICGLVTAHITKIMLASQFMRYYEMNWNFVAGEITFRGKTFKLLEAGEEHTMQEGCTGRDDGHTAENTDLSDLQGRV